MEDVKIVFNSEMWEIYKNGSEIPIRLVTSYNRVINYCFENKYRIVEVDDSNLD
jgi:hypothetical protein